MLTINPKQFEEINEEIWNELRSYILEPRTMKKGSIKGKSIEKKYDEDLMEIDTVLLVGGSTRIYKIRDILSEIFGSEKLDTTLDADTCVAQGAAFHAANECKFLSDASQLTFSDIIPFAIGIEVQGSKFEPIIKEGSTIPTTAEKVFTTMTDNQTNVAIRVAQGQRVSFKDNHYLGNFNLNLAKPEPRGVPQIKIIVEVQPNNQFTVRAEEINSGNKAKAEFSRYDASLSPDKIKEMQDEYEKHKDDDEKLRDLFKVQDQYNSIVYQAKQTAGTIEDEAVKKGILSEVAKIEAWYGANKDHTKESLKARIDEFNAAIAKLTGGEAPTDDQTQQEDGKDEL